jgi:hypothetical protein
MYTTASRSSSSLESAVSPLQRRRDSLFSNTSANSDEDNEIDYCNAMDCSMPPSVGTPGTPRRRFPRRHAFCHFQLVQDAVEAILEDMNGQASERPQIPLPPSADTVDSPMSSLRRKFDESQHEESDDDDHGRQVRQGLHPPTPFPSPRKAARNVHRPNPSTNVLFSDNFTL